MASSYAPSTLSTAVCAVVSLFSTSGSMVPFFTPSSTFFMPPRRAIAALATVSSSRAMSYGALAAASAALGAPSAVSRAFLAPSANALT